jgi:hypothetical protein
VIINPNFPSGYVTFCDDVRLEMTGKTTQVGVYNGPLILFSYLPTVIHQLWAVIVFRFEPPKTEFKPVIKLFQTGVDAPLFQTEIDFPIETAEVAHPKPDPDAIKFHQITLQAQLNGLSIKEPCALKVRAYVNDDEVPLGTLQIVVMSPELMADDT